jgi:hypothetical protein
MSLTSSRDSKRLAKWLSDCEGHHFSTKIYEKTPWRLLRAIVVVAIHSKHNVVKNGPLLCHFFCMVLFIYNSA